VGHAAIRTQLGWCGRDGVPKALITHSGWKSLAAILELWEELCAI
jgi:hypothetical protein